MMGSVKVSGVGSVMASFRSIATKVPDRARKVMHRSADRVVKLAKLMVPEDTGNLMESIRIESVYVMGGGHGRLQINVIVGNQIVVNSNGETVDLNDYALKIHELYGMMSPGPRTREKQNANPEIYVGERFLTRAIDAERPRLNAEMVRIVEETIIGETDL
jgi:hypothetical protein